MDMRNAFAFLRENATIVQLTISLVGVLTAVCAAYITYRLAPVTAHLNAIDQVDAQVIADQHAHDPLIEQQQATLTDMKQDIARIDATTQNMYTILSTRKK